jgi:ATP-dependent DNA helicase RecG
LRAAEAMYENLRQTTFRDQRIGLLHGQMHAARKDEVMGRFRDGNLDILVATSVVEVGVDVPNATIMLVEHAERFGLAQLHQLRGRIGRGTHKSYCILQGAPTSRDAWRRLKVMERTTDGFVIAEEDFKIRGMGNLLGREQSGVPILRVADPLADLAILTDARDEAKRLVEQDPTFTNPAYEPLREQARRVYREAGPFVKVG